MPYPGVPKKDTPKMERCVKDVMSQGHDKSSAVAICHNSIVGKGIELDGISLKINKEAGDNEIMFEVVKKPAQKGKGVISVKQTTMAKEKKLKKAKDEEVKEEKKLKKQDEPVDEKPAEEAPAEEAPAETPVDEKPAEEEAPAEDKAEEAPAEEGADEEAGDEEEDVSIEKKSEEMLKSILQRLDELEEMVKQAPAEDAAADDDAEDADADKEEAPAADAEDSPEKSAAEEEAPVEEDQPKEEAAEEESDKIAKTEKAETKKADTSSEGANEVLAELKKITDRLEKLENEPAQAKIVVSRELYAKMDDKSKTRIEEINKRLDEILEIKDKKPDQYNVTLMDEALKLVEEKKRLKGEI